MSPYASRRSTGKMPNRPHLAHLRGGGRFHFYGRADFSEINRKRAARELTEFCGKLGEFCEKLGEFAFTHK